jgi:hypothetical protein
MYKPVGKSQETENVYMIFNCEYQECLRSSFFGNIGKSIAGFMGNIVNLQNISIFFYKNRSLCIWKGFSYEGVHIRVNTLEIVSNRML